MVLPPLPLLTLKTTYTVPPKPLAYSLCQGLRRLSFSSLLSGSLALWLSGFLALSPPPSLARGSYRRGFSAKFLAGFALLLMIQYHLVLFLHCRNLGTGRWCAKVCACAQFQ